MIKQALYHRFVAGILSIMLVLTCVHADNLEVSVVTSKDKSLHLAERMESYGYLKSALHYYKLVLLEPNLEEIERNKIDSKVIALQLKINQTQQTTTLPNLDEMLHIETVSTVASESVSTERPEAFPKTRLNKKNWIIGTLIVVGVGAIAYAVTKNLRKKNDPAATSVQIGF